MIGIYLHTSSFHEAITSLTLTHLTLLKSNFRKDYIEIISSEHFISSHKYLAFLNRLGTSFNVSSLKRCLQVSYTFRNTLQSLASLIVYLVRQLAERSEIVASSPRTPPGPQGHGLGPGLLSQGGRGPAPSPFPPPKKKKENHHIH